MFPNKCHFPENHLTFKSVWLQDGKSHSFLDILGNCDPHGQWQKLLGLAMKSWSILSSVAVWKCESLDFTVKEKPFALDIGSGSNIEIESLGWKVEHKLWWPSMPHLHFFNTWEKALRDAERPPTCVPGCEVLLNRPVQKYVHRWLVFSKLSQIIICQSNLNLYPKSWMESINNKI